MATESQITQVRDEIIPWLKNSYKVPRQPWYGRLSDSDIAFHTVQANKLQGYIDILRSLKVSIISVLPDEDSRMYTQKVVALRPTDAILVKDVNGEHVILYKPSPKDIRRAKLSSISV